MNNNIFLVGRIYNIEKQENRVKVDIAVPKQFKNAEGVYETDFIPVYLFKMVAESTMEYCKKGDLIGIKGRLEVSNGILEVIAEKVSFLSTRKE